MPPWLVAVLAVVAACGGAAGITSAVRLFTVEPKLARREESRDLWTEIRARSDDLTKERANTEELRIKLEAMRQRVWDVEDKVEAVQDAVKRCEDDRHRLQHRLDALEGK
jgi:septal ring factor EnvC (AmiA/AmiB activator)